jgi:hypothetical protein
VRLLSERQAFEKLRALQAEFEENIRRNYEDKAKPCITCETPGACCLDEHFVNVHISRLEAEAIRRKLDSLEPEKRNEIYSRIEAAIERYELSPDGDIFERKFACPLFEKGIGCLVHNDGKPAACVMHACYENEADLPPHHLQSEQEMRIDRLNERTYGRSQPWLPIPLAIRSGR